MLQAWLQARSGDQEAGGGRRRGNPGAQAGGKRSGAAGVSQFGGRTKKFGRSKKSGSTLAYFLIWKLASEVGPAARVQAKSERLRAPMIFLTVQAQNGWWHMHADPIPLP